MQPQRIQKSTGLRFEILRRPPDGMSPVPERRRMESLLSIGRNCIRPQPRLGWLRKKSMTAIPSSNIRRLLPEARRPAPILPQVRPSTQRELCPEVNSIGARLAQTNPCRARTSRRRHRNPVSVPGSRFLAFIHLKDPSAPLNRIRWSGRSCGNPRPVRRLAGEV